MRTTSSLRPLSFSPILFYLLQLWEKILFFFMFTVGDENGVQKVARLICYPLLVKDRDGIYSFYDAFFELVDWIYVSYDLATLTLYNFYFCLFFGSRSGSEAIESALVGNLSRHKGPVSFTIRCFACFCSFCMHLFVILWLCDIFSLILLIVRFADWSLMSLLQISLHLELMKVKSVYGILQNLQNLAISLPLKYVISDI